MTAKHILSRISLVLLGVLLFFSLEAALRLLWEPAETASEQLLLSSIDPFEQEGADFITREEYRSALRPSRFNVKKEPASLRIFCLGGSATFGYPYPPRYSWPAVLQRNIQALYPERVVEVINLGGTSYGTNRALGLLRGIVKYNPDLVIVYSGNNEFVEDSYRSQALVHQDNTGFIEKLYLAKMFKNMLPTKKQTSQAETFAVEPGDSKAFFFSADVDGSVYRPTEMQAKEIYYRYRENLEKMAELAKEKGFALLLSTVASNLATWPPDADERLPANSEQRLLWSSAVAAANQLAAQNKNKDALAAYRRALDVFDGNATLNFALGSLLLEEGQAIAAMPYLLRAKDLDPSSVRATTKMNDAVRAVSMQQALPLVDIEAMMLSVAAQGIPGDSLFVDNVHPTPLGNLHIARGFSSKLPESKRLLVPDEEATNRFWESEFSRSSELPPLDATTAFTWGQVYLRKGRLDKARAMLQSAIDQGYSHPSAQLYLADTLAKTGKVEEAFTLLHESVNRHPDYEEPYPLLAHLAVPLGQFDVAIQAYFRTLQGEHPAAENFSSLALLLIGENRIAEAEKIIDRGLVNDPEHCALNAAKGRVFENRGEIDRAETIYRATIERDSSCQAGWENLGLLQMNYQSFAAAATTFAAALEQPGAIASHHLNLGLAYFYDSNNPERAYEQFKIFAEQEPSYIHHIPAPYRDKILAERDLRE